MPDIKKLKMQRVELTSQLKDAYNVKQEKESRVLKSIADFNQFEDDTSPEALKAIEAHEVFLKEYGDAIIKYDNALETFDRFANYERDIIVALEREESNC